MNERVFEISKVFQEEASQLAEARRRSKVIHSSGDIDASGDEVEIPFFYWMLYELTNEQLRGGQALAILMLSIFEHLQNCVLMNPPIEKYMNHILREAAHRSSLLDSKKIEEILQKGVAKR